MPVKNFAATRPRIVGAGEPVKIASGFLRSMTDKAIEVVFDSGRVQWVPMSVIHDDSELYGRDSQGKAQDPGERGTIVVKRWWAIDHNFAKA